MANRLPKNITSEARKMYMPITPSLRAVGREHLDVLDEDPADDSVQKDQTSDHGQHDPDDAVRKRDRGEGQEQRAGADDEGVVAVRKDVDAQVVGSRGVIDDDFSSR